jgi:hypothetical protein
MGDGIAHGAQHIGIGTRARSPMKNTRYAAHKKPLFAV